MKPSRSSSSLLVLCLSSFFASAQIRAGGSPYRIIFPDLDTGTGIGYAVLNPGSEPVSVTFRAFGVSGQLIAGSGIENPKVLELAPDRQLASFASQIFNFPPELVAGGWVEATTDDGEIKGFFLTLEDGLSRVDGADAVSTTGDDFFFPLSSQLNAASSDLHVVNPGETAAMVSVELHGSSGDLISSSNMNLPAHGKLRLSLSEFAMDLSGPSSAGGGEEYLRVTSSAPTAAYQKGRNGDSIFGLNGLRTQEVEALVSPQLASSPAIGTQVQLFNADSETTIFQITARSETGALLPQAGSNPRQLMIPANGLEVFDVAAFFELPPDQTVSGWIEIRNLTPGEPIRAAGSVNFGDFVNGRFSAALPLQAEGRLIQYFSHVAQGRFGLIEWFTGLAILNTQSIAANVLVSVRNGEGEVTASTGLMLPAGARLSKILPEILPDLADQAGGSIEVISSIPIQSFSLFGLADLSNLAAIPTQPLEDLSTSGLELVSSFSATLDTSDLGLTETSGLVDANGTLKLPAPQGFRIEVDFQESDGSPVSDLLQVELKAASTGEVTEGLAFDGKLDVVLAPDEYELFVFVPASRLSQNPALTGVDPAGTNSRDSLGRRRVKTISASEDTKTTARLPPSEELPRARKTNGKVEHLVSKLLFEFFRFESDDTKASYTIDQVFRSAALASLMAFPAGSSLSFSKEIVPGSYDVSALVTAMNPTAQTFYTFPDRVVIPEESLSNPDPVEVNLIFPEFSEVLAQVLGPEGETIMSPVGFQGESSSGFSQFPLRFLVPVGETIRPTVSRDGKVNGSTVGTFQHLLNAFVVPAQMDAALPAGGSIDAGTFQTGDNPELFPLTLEIGNLNGARVLVSAESVRIDAAPDTRYFGRGSVTNFNGQATVQVPRGRIRVVVQR